MTAGAKVAAKGYTKTPAVPALSEGSFITLAALLFLAGALMSAGRH